MKRVLRIWPLYFLIVIFSSVSYPILEGYLGTPKKSSISLLYQLLFLSNFDLINYLHLCGGGGVLMQNITWSVSIEEQFYLFWPLIFIFFKPKKWLFPIVSIIIISFLFRIYYRDDSIILYFNTLSVLMDMAIGGILAFLIHNKKGVKSFFENSSTYHKLLPIFLVFFFLFWKDYLFELKYFEAISRIFISTIFAFIIGCQSLTIKESFINFKNFKFGEKWGKYTYGIYLIHPISLTIITFLFSKLNYFNNKIILGIVFYTLISFILTLTLSKLSYNYYESIFLRIKKKYDSKF